MVKDSLLTFLKNRFPLIIMFSLILTITMHLSVSEITLIILILTILLFLHSFLHEFGHAITASLLGFKVTRFTTNRVNIEDEPSTFEEIKSSMDKTKYGIIGISGCITTLSVGYILLSIAHNSRKGMDIIQFYIWYFTLLIYLLGDAGYLILGSISMKGDPVGISAGFNISRWVVFSFGLFIVLINVLLIWRFFYIG